MFMSLYCFPVRISVAGSDVGLFLTGGRMIEEGFRRFVIAIERRHGVGDRLIAVVVLQYVLDVGQCREAAEGYIAVFQRVAITQFISRDALDLDVAICVVVILDGSDILVIAVDQSELRCIRAVLLEVEAQGSLCLQNQAVAVILDTAVCKQRVDCRLIRDITCDAADLVFIQTDKIISDLCIRQSVDIVAKLILSSRAVVEHGFYQRYQRV